MKRAETVAQFCILRWLEANFYINRMKVDFISSNTARITGYDNRRALVICDECGVYLENDETPGAATPRESGI